MAGDLVTPLVAAGVALLVFVVVVAVCVVVLRLLAVVLPGTGTTPADVDREATAKETGDTADRTTRDAEATGPASATDEES